jgi:peptidoglycan-associated lipoprotein
MCGRAFAPAAGDAMNRIAVVLTCSVAALAGCPAAATKTAPSVTSMERAAAEPAPVAEAGPPATRACREDVECGAGRRCEAGACADGERVTACGVERVTFGYDDATLSDDARHVLQADANCLRRHGVSSLVVEGHCDERGTVEYNVALGQRRAEAVRRYLADLGVAGPIRSVSFGKEAPLVRGAGEEVWRQNRRAELRQPGERLSDGSAAAEAR